MYDLGDEATRHEINRIGEKLLQNVVELALEEGYSHGIITGGFIKQAYTVMRLTVPGTPEERKALFLEMAAEMAGRVEEASRPRA